MKDDPLVELEKVQRKVSDYYQSNPEATRLSEALAHELKKKTKEYIEYLDKRRHGVA